MASYNKLNDTHQQVNDVILIMKDNINKTLARDEKLGDIESKTEDLEANSKRFEKVSKKLKQKLMCKNIKFMVVLFLIVLFLILVIVLITLKK